MQKRPYLTAQQTHSKKPRLRDRTDRAWFSPILRHPARKLSRSIVTTPEPAIRMRPLAEVKPINV